MNIYIKHITNYSSLSFFTLLLIIPATIQAQRFVYGSSLRNSNISYSTGMQSINNNLYRKANDNISNPHSEYYSTNTRSANNIDSRNSNINNRNTNIDNNINPIARPAIRLYPLLPYFYGGLSYYTFFPYYCHPFTPLIGIQYSFHEVSL